MAFTRAYVGYVHAMAHTLGGFYGVPHGHANAVILPHVIEAYGEKAYKKLAELADAVGIKGNTTADKAKAFIQAIRDMNASMDIPTKIEGRWTIKDEDIPTMVKRALKEGNPLYPVPEIWGYEEMYAMFKKSNKRKTIQNVPRCGTFFLPFHCFAFSLLSPCSQRLFFDNA